MIAEGLDTLKNMAHDMYEVSFPVMFVFIPLCIYAFPCFFFAFKLIIYGTSAGTG